MKKILIILSVFLLYTCVGSGNSKEHDLHIDFEKNNKEFNYANIEIVQGIIVSNESLYNIKFESMSGGNESFLGYVYKEFHGDKFKERVSIKCNSVTYYFSVNDILNWSIKKVGGADVYIAPEICKN